MNRESQLRRLGRLEDIALARQLLSAIPERERIALDGYYGGVKAIAQIEAELKWPPGHLADIRLELSTRFFLGLLGRRALPIGAEDEENLA